MTSTPAPPALDHLVLRSPDALVAALPYLLGFHPRESAIAVWLQDRRIALTQRLDLPSDPVHHAAWLAAMWHHTMAEAAHELILVVASVHPADPALLALVADRAAAAGIEMRDVLRVDEGRWWSLLCTDEECCPPEGRIVAPAVASAVAAEFTLVGRAPMAGREELEDSLGPDEVRQALVAAALAAAPALPAGPAREQWREERIADTLSLICDGPGDGPRRAPRIADALWGLDDVRVRDTVLWEVSRWSPEDLQSALVRLSVVLRSAPAGHVAPVASCAAVVAWLLGDGARAHIAVDRARRDDGEYSLAVLLDASLRAGLPPQAWRESMAALTRDDCRHGAVAGRTAAS
jgi:Domain of unknown function (DUF4192)